MIVVFSTMAALVAYVCLGYPVPVALAGRLLERRVRRGPHFPTLGVVVAPYDEAEVIDALGSRIFVLANAVAATDAEPG
jgi:hypothetical protein